MVFFNKEKYSRRYSRKGNIKSVLLSRKPAKRKLKHYQRKKSKLNSEESSDVVNQASGSHPGVDTGSQHEINNLAGDIAGSSHFISKLSLEESDLSQTHDDIFELDHTFLVS